MYEYVFKKEIKMAALWLPVEASGKKHLLHKTKTKIPVWAGSQLHWNTCLATSPERWFCMADLKLAVNANPIGQIQDIIMEENSRFGWISN